MPSFLEHIAYFKNMKTIQTFNIIILALLIALLLFATQNSKALSLYAEEEAITSEKLEEYTRDVLSGEKEKNVDHLLAVLQKTAVAYSSGAKAIQTYSSSLNEMKNIIMGLIIMQIIISAMYYIQHKNLFKSKSNDKDVLN